MTQIGADGEWPANSANRREFERNDELLFLFAELLLLIQTKHMKASFLAFVQINITLPTQHQFMLWNILLLNSWIRTISILLIIYRDAILDISCWCVSTLLAWHEDIREFILRILNACRNWLSEA